MRRLILLLWASTFFAGSLKASPVRSGAEVLDTAIHLKKAADSRNMEDFDELQKAITRVLERRGEDIFAILAKSRHELHKKIHFDLRQILTIALKAYPNRESSEYQELEHLITVLWDARNLLLKRTGLTGDIMRKFFSDRYILGIMKEHGREVVAAKVALIYILQHISKESIMNLKALKMNHPLVITNQVAREALKKTALYDHEENVLYLPNSGFVASGDPSLQNFTGTDVPGFAELCLFGKNGSMEFSVTDFIKLWKVEKEGLEIPQDGISRYMKVLFLMARLTARNPVKMPSELKAADFIVTKQDIMIVEETPSTLESVLVIHNTRKPLGSKEGIVAERINLPAQDYWVLRPRG